MSKGTIIGEPAAAERVDLSPEMAVSGIRHHAQCLRTQCDTILTNLATADDLLMQAESMSNVLSAENSVQVNTPQGPQQITRREFKVLQAQDLRNKARDAMAGVLRHGDEAGALIRALFEATGVKVL